jgi:hypothetical protein
VIDRNYVQLNLPRQTEVRRRISHDRRLPERHFDKSDPYCKRSGGTNVERSGLSILFRTREWLTLAQLARAWGDELAKTERDRQHYVQDLVHTLKEDIVNGRLDDSGPLHGDRRLGLCLITPDSKAGFIEGRELLDIFNVDQASWILDRVVVMKEAVLDFARRRQLPPPSWWSESDRTPTQPTNDASRDVAVPITKVPSRSVGKQPRITKYLIEHFPGGVPEPGLSPRSTLIDEILKWDKTLKSLDEATLKKAIDTYNASLGKKKLIRNYPIRTESDRFG